ncbi:MAG: hypothetical protein Q9214_001168 [Letrouitia sp. 1 TL-2023]
MLSCSSRSAAGVSMHWGSTMTSPQCRASNTAFLTTLAWCMRMKCAPYNVPTSILETFWEKYCTGDPTVAPKWDYGTTLRHVVQPPNRELTSDETLNSTSLVPHYGWNRQYHTLTFLETEESVHARYGVIITVTGFTVPIILTWLDYLPYMTGILERIKPYLGYPATVGTYHVRPLPYLLGNAPTVGQSLYVALMAILTVILTTANYQTTPLSAWYANQHQEILAFVTYRTGTLAFALAPLVLLFSSRNNVLLWLSDWSHSTYLLLHRWIARIFGIQVLLHSFFALALYIDRGAYPAEEKMPYWIWGAVATVAVSIMLVASGLYMRRWSYEVFLITHVVLAVLVIVGSWYHVDIRFERQWGYEMWLYAACAVWFFDRLARVLRILKTGMRHAKVTDIGDGFVRVDVEGIRWAATPGKHVYAFFPTLNPLRPWENHPFSLLPTALVHSPNQSISAKSSDLESRMTDQPGGEKHNGTTARTKTVHEDVTTAGLTLFIRKSTGMTNVLKAHESLLTFLDGPYQNNSTKHILQCDRLLLIGGGIGITGLLPWVRECPNTKLCWSVKKSAECLVQAFDDVLSEVHEKDVRVGRRLDIKALLSSEVLSGWAKIGVVVCGPGGLCDDARALVVAAAKERKAVFELSVDAYSW